MVIWLTPLAPQLSTWFMYDPKYIFVALLKTYYIVRQLEILSTYYAFSYSVFANFAKRSK